MTIKYIDSFSLRSKLRALSGPFILKGTTADGVTTIVAPASHITFENEINITFQDECASASIVS